MDIKEILSILGILVLLLLVSILKVLPYREKGMGGPEMTGRATVVSRRVGAGRAPAAGSHGNYLVTFALSDGETIELYTTNVVFRQMKEGLRGQLTWQGKNFCHFDPDQTA